MRAGGTQAKCGSLDTKQVRTLGLALRMTGFNTQVQTAITSLATKTAFALQFATKKIHCL